jgi:diguanylate cyclase (GGDEF)-like protein/PAS domain S-box-containing protein
MGIRATKCSRSTASTRKRERTASARPHADDDVQALIDITPNSYYWEQDTQFRFTRFAGSILKLAGVDTNPYIGKRRWEIGWIPAGDRTWEHHRAQLDAHEAFSEFLFKYTTPAGEVRYLSSSGQPMFDRTGRFKGYRGMSRDITRRIWIERRLAIERAVAQVLAGANNIADAAPRIIRAICDQLQWSCGVCWEIDGTTEKLRCIEAIGTPATADFIAATRKLSPLTVDTKGLVRQTCATREPVWIADVTVEPGFRRAADAKRSGLRSALAFPIVADTEVIGAIEFFSTDMLNPDDELLKGIAYVGGGIGQFYRRQRLEEQLQRFRAAVDVSGDPIYLTDRATMRFIDVNETAAQATGYSREELLKLGPHDISLMRREDIEWLYDQVIAAGAEGVTVESVRHTKSGEVRTVELLRRALNIGGRWIIVTISHDITSRKRAEKATQRIGRMFAALSATNEAIMRAVSPEELYQRVCDAAVNGGKFLTTAVLLPDIHSGSAQVVAVTGTVAEQLRSARISVDEGSAEGNGLVGIAFRTHETCVSQDLLADPRAKPWHALARSAGVASGAAVPLLRNDDSIGALLLYSSETYAFDDDIVKLLERMAENIAFALDNFEREGERKRGQERIQYLATHDGLTGLPNRVMFNELLSLAIESARRYERKFAVLFIDLDRFKLINDTLGHQAGDVMLKEMSARLKDCLRASDVVARLGGDEFVVLVQEAHGADQVATVARKILSAAMAPMEILGQECRVTASIGIAMYPVDAEDEQSLMRNADIAMYLAKEEGKNNFQFYAKEIKAQSLERMALETHLRRALERNEFALNYQAKLDLKTGDITGVEALLRWNNPELGSVSPMQFIPVAEESGLIVPIGRWVLKTACEQNVAWQREGLRPICMAVNLSPRQFADPDLLKDIGATLAETGMAPEHLELEITESMVMHNTERAVTLLAAIKEMGARLAIDDFGTGYSSLAQLKRFPIDTLKVDRSFIREIPKDSEDRAITEAIIAMGKSLSLTIVAEGVETEEQQAFLRAHACDEMQGYYFSKPIEANKFAELLRTHTRPVSF